MILQVTIMTINTTKIERDLDGFRLYSWFNKELAIEKTKYLPKIKVCSKSITNAWDQDERTKFKIKCSRILQLFFKTDIKFFIIRFSTSQHALTRIEKRKGVWGSLKSSLNKILSFEDEIEITNSNLFFRIGLAKIKPFGFYEAISILENDPNQNFIISTRIEFTKEHLIEMLYEFTECDKNVQIFPLVLYTITNFQGIIRWGDSSEEICLDYISK
ncbi:hypothetical protein Lepto1489_21890 (plasmid) [Leptospira interrogans serovar Bataviae]|uniref:Uncharacterized protein n=2 Tax=Leptospira interrogans TaxID=173 RepID=A0AAP9WQ18_LEPIR|nr:hypothetical protein Lepto1489_21890 [Leptospira interrogans serovar Bataviae]